MNLTRRTLLGVLKYPCSFSTLWNVTKERHVPAQFHELDQNEWKTVKCYYDEEQDILTWILSEFTKQDQRTFQDYNEKSEDNYCSQYKSFDCSIMELADDIAGMTDRYALKMYSKIFGGEGLT